MHNRRILRRTDIRDAQHGPPAVGFYRLGGSARLDSFFALPCRAGWAGRSAALFRGVVEGDHDNGG